jgi:hypothetical protein
LLSPKQPSSASYLRRASPVIGVKPPARSGAAAQVPAQLDSTCRPPLHRRHSRIRRCRGLLDRIYRCSDLPVWIHHLFGRIVVFMARSVVVAFPTGSAPPMFLWRAQPPCPAQTRALPPASLAGLLDDRTREEARRFSVYCCCPFCVAPPTVDARTSTPPRRTRLLLCLQAAATHHLDFGYLGIQGLSSTWSAHRSLLQPQRSHPHDDAIPGGLPIASYLSFYSSLIVCRAPVAAVGDVRQCVFYMYVGRHHCWTADPLELGFPRPLYICNYLLCNTTSS